MMSAVKMLQDRNG